MLEILQTWKKQVLILKEVPNGLIKGPMVYCPSAAGVAVLVGHVYQITGALVYL